MYTIYIYVCIHMEAHYSSPPAMKNLAGCRLNHLCKSTSCVLKRVPRLPRLPEYFLGQESTAAEAEQANTG